MLYVTGDGYDINGDYFWNKENVGNTFPNLEKMLLYGMLCNNASLIVKKANMLSMVTRRMGLYWLRQGNLDSSGNCMITTALLKNFRLIQNGKG